jgi:hypothetical protein
VRGRNGTYPIVAGDEPLNATVVLGNQASADAGDCGETVFIAGDCFYTPSNIKLICR